MELDDTIRNLAPKLLRFSVGLCGDRSTGEEVAQTVLTTLVQRWRTHGPPRDPAAFAFSIARRRAGRARLKARLFEPLGRVLSRAHSDSNPEVQASQREALQRVEATLGLLSRKDREALLLVISGLDSSSAAKSLGLSTSAFKMRVHRARQRLIDRMESCQDAQTAQS